MPISQVEPYIVERFLVKEISEDGLIKNYKNWSTYRDTFDNYGYNSFEKAIEAIRLSGLSDLIIIKTYSSRDWK